MEQKIQFGGDTKLVACPVEDILEDTIRRHS